MSYRDLLYPWCIVQHLPNLQRSQIARFRRRNDADEHLRALKRLNSSGDYEIVFDPIVEMLITPPQKLSRVQR